MARTAVFALVLVALLASGYAADTGRSLQQVAYDCNGAKRIGTVRNACNLLCTCAGSLNKQYQAQNMKNMCLRLCNACQTAASTCKPGSGLPQACQAGTRIKEVNSCINTFLRSQQG